MSFGIDTGGEPDEPELLASAWDAHLALVLSVTGWLSLLACGFVILVLSQVGTPRNSLTILIPISLALVTWSLGGLMGYNALYSRWGRDSHDQMMVRTVAGLAMVAGGAPIGLLILGGSGACFFGCLGLVAAL